MFEENFNGVTKVLLGFLKCFKDAVAFESSQLSKKKDGLFELNFSSRISGDFDDIQSVVDKLATWAGLDWDCTVIFIRFLYHFINSCQAQNLPSLALCPRNTTTTHHSPTLFIAFIERINSLGKGCKTAYSPLIALIIQQRPNDRSANVCKFNLMVAG